MREHTREEIHYKAWRREENELLDRRTRAHEALEDALEELSRSWGWKDLSRQVRACESALSDAKAVLIDSDCMGDQLTLSFSDSPTSSDVRVLING